MGCIVALVAVDCSDSYTPADVHTADLAVRTSAEASVVLLDYTQAW